VLWLQQQEKYIRHIRRELELGMKMTEINYVPEIQEVISSGRVLNVLIVDDSKMVRTAIREILELGSIQVSEAGDGKEALEIIKNNCPDLVLLDIFMPEINGIEVLRIIRQAHSKLELPVVLVTSKESSHEIVQALDLGANDYVTKPIDFDVLWARLSNQLMQKQASEYLRSAQATLENQIVRRTSELSSSNQKLKKEVEVRMLAETELQKQANFDSLTDLPNRSLATDRLDQTLVKAKRRDLKPCLAFLDLDNFKYVNDTFGHAAGDELLKEVARRLTDCARESDTVARLGGDEFLLILDDEHTVKNEKREIGIRHIGDRIIESFAKPFIVDGNELNVTPSLGFAIYPQDGDDSETLMRHADTAMYRSKQEGKNAYCFYSPDMTAKAKMRMDVEAQLQYALERNEFSIYYQPIIDVQSGKIIKAEALLRWDCEELGSITTDYFIPIAEEASLIIPIGSWVIQSACAQVKKWRDAGWSDICVTVNVSAYQFQMNTELVELLDKALKEHELTVDAIQLELTEDVLTSDKNNIAETMEKLQQMGVKLLINDFGSGLASLSILQRYNFDSIKINRRYTESMLSDQKDKKLVKAVIAMTKGLGMTVVAEGVETKQQFDFLIDAQCEYVQGYYFSKPVPADELILLDKVVDTELPYKNNILVSAPAYIFTEDAEKTKTGCCDGQS
jgi:diguanylate cyclase (GGDEF)-like protein